jgi:hypothetical protein
MSAWAGRFSGVDFEGETAEWAAVLRIGEENALAVADRLVEAVRSPLRETARTGGVAGCDPGGMHSRLTRHFSLAVARHHAPQSIGVDDAQPPASDTLDDSALA